MNNKNSDKFSALMSSARAVFISELDKKLNDIKSLVEGDSEEFPMEKLKEALRFFHSIKGTAGTLGLEELAAVGNNAEGELKKFIEMRENLNKKIKEELINAAFMVNDRLRLAKAGYTTEASLEKADDETYTDLGKILLIDDDIVTLKLLESTFSSEGYTVYICDDSLSAMDIIETSMPDIILLDIMMPKCDGYELLAKIKANPEYLDISVVFLSAMDGLDARLKGMKAGIDDYITKPFAIEEIVLRVEMILRRANKFKEKLLKDSLTGAYSRYSLNEKIGDELEEFKRGKSSFSIAFLDIDHFKKINDSYGHSAGDFILEEFVDYLYKNLRSSDYIFRYGGEEFIVLLHNADEKQAYEVIDRIRESYSANPVEFDNNSIAVTFSAGVIGVTDKTESVQKLLNFADEAMYLSKKSGRNKVTIFTDTGGTYRSKRTLLLVDDENTILKLLNIKLSEEGYNIKTAANGRDAIEQINSFHPDAVILDRVLPDMDGLEVCRAARQNSDTQSIPIMILSQKKSDKDISDGLKSGANDYVVKPFSIPELKERILKVLRERD